MAFFNLVSWHGQVHELERCLDTQRGGADWRSILKAYILLQPKRDLDFGFGTLHQRLLHHPMKPKYSLRTYQLVSEDVRCRDFCPAHIIVEKALPYINVDFWGGWPPPPALIPLPAPRKKPRLVMLTPFVQKSSRPRVSSTSCVSNSQTPSSHAAGVAAASEASASSPSIDAPLAAPPLQDGELEHGIDVTEENVEESCGNGGTGNPILDAWMAEAGITPTVPSPDDAPTRGGIVPLLAAAPAVEEEDEAIVSSVVSSNDRRLCSSVVVRVCLCARLRVH